MRQFWQAMNYEPRLEDIEFVSNQLLPSQLRLFLKMQPSEQTHSIWICKKLIEQGQTEQELLAAALLHDIGKTRYPLKIWDRAMIVILNTLLPGVAARLSQKSPDGWARPFVVAVRHPEWGAEMALNSGATPLTARLIRRHHEPVAETHKAIEDVMLYHMQVLDNEG